MGSKHLLLTLFLFSNLTSGVAMAVDEPKYSVVKKAENYEIRSYGKKLVAETTVEGNFDDAGNKAFRVLADYIFGNNKSKTKIAMTAPVSQQAKSEKIAMTAPVIQAKDPKGFVVQFVMPEEFTMETLPTPNDSRVVLRSTPEQTVAVYSYSGSWSETRYQKKLAEFLDELKKDKIKTIGEPVFARFNSPLRLWFLRRNEIWIEVAR